MASGSQSLFRQRMAAWWTLVIGLSLTAVLGWELHRESVELDRHRLARRVTEIQSQLDSRLEKSEMLLNNLRDYLMVSGQTNNQVFDRWCYDNGLTINCPWIHGVMVATNRLEWQWRTRLPAQPATWSENDWEAFRELAWRRVLDCDIAMWSEVGGQKKYLENYSLMRLYRDSYEPLGLSVQGSRLGMSARQKVMRDSDNNRIPGALYYAPVYHPRMSEFLTIEGLTRNQSKLARWMHLTSLIVAPVDFNKLVHSVNEGAAPDVEMELFSSTNQTPDTWLNISKDAPRASDPQFEAYLTHRQNWPMYGQKFSIYFYTTPLFEAQSPRRLAKVAVGAGFLLTLMATTLVGLALRSRNQQENLTNQIRDARDALAEAQKAREKFSRDLHDGTIQSLYAIQLGLGHLGEKLEHDPSRARRDFATVRKELDAVIAEVRNFVNAGDSANNRAVNFSAVLNALVQRAQAGASARITLQCDNEAASQLSAADAIQLANIAREAISNCLRHAKPARIEVALNVQPNGIKLTVTDDGCGFDPDSPHQFGVGLKSMQTRAQELGGTFVIQSSQGHGTRIQISVPTQEATPT